MKIILFIFLLIFLTPTSGLKAQQEKLTIINKQHYIGRLDKQGFYLITTKRDTVFKLHEADYFTFKFEDFNRDGYKDIFLEWTGNMPERYSVYLFLPSTGKFKELRNLNRFPAATQVGRTKYYYSYYRAGCADNTWGSDLFYIKNYEAIKIANIKGEGCGSEEGIYIYKMEADKKNLIHKLPITTIEKYKDYKWGFIKQYWSKNYNKFL